MSRPDQPIFHRAENLRRAGVASFHKRLLAQKKVDVIRDTQKMLGDLNQRPSVERVVMELVQRIDLHELHAGFVKDQFFASQFNEIRERRIGPRITIMERQSKQRFVLRKIGVVQSPGVNAEPRDFSSLLPNRAQAILDFIVKLKKIPAKRAIHYAGSRLGIDGILPIEFYRPPVTPGRLGYFQPRDRRRHNFWRYS